MKRLMLIVTAIAVASVVLVSATATMASGGNPNDMSLEERMAAANAASSASKVIEDLDMELTAMGNVITIPAGDFTVDGYDPDGYWYSFAGGYMVGTVASGCCLSVGFQLPMGAAKVNKVYIYAYDYNAGSSEWFELHYTTLSTGARTNVGMVSTSDSAGVVAYAITPSQKAVTSGRAWEITTCARLGIEVYGVRVTYQ